MGLFAECTHGPCCGEQGKLTIDGIRDRIGAGSWVFDPDPDSPCPIRAGRDWRECPAISQD